MKRNIKLEAFYPFPPERVWRAITDAEALSKWLMPNDFEPRVGHKFNFKTKPAPGFDGVVHCEVLKLEEPRHLSMSWKGGPVDSTVDFILESAPNGTKLLFEQRGFAGLKAVMVSYMLGSGWKKMFRGSLLAVIENIDDLSSLDGKLESCHALEV
jgi:uncharacterized protein YndB with AHSA1/START domain